MSLLERVNLSNKVDALYEVSMVLNGSWLKPTHSRKNTMKFYNQQHEFYCGVDLHANSMRDRPGR
jgi:hypothetical protein